MMAWMGVALLGVVAAGSDEPVARWDFDEGAGAEVRDVGGNECHGTLDEAKWVACGAGHALEFDGARAHVDCGHPPALDVTGPVTLAAWVYPTAHPASETGIAGKSFDSYALTAYGDGCYYWYISSGGNKCHAPIQVRRWGFVVGTFDGEALKLYVNGALADSCPSQFDAVNHANNFYVGCIARAANSAAMTDGFRGIIDGVRVYTRALNEEEIAAQYEQERGGYHRMESGLDRVVVTPFCYLEDGVIFVDVDFGALSPLRDNERAEVTLWRDGAAEAMQRVPVESVPDSGVVRDIRLDAVDLEPGAYELRATFVNQAGKAYEDKAPFAYPVPLEVPAPDERVAGPLPPPPAPSKFDFEVGKGGAFRIGLGGDTYAVESTCSYPRGGENTLGLAAPTRAEGEPSWRVAVEQEDGTTHRVKADGKYYAIERELIRRATHVLVRDTFTNLTDAPLGIMLSNHIDARGKDGVSSPQFPIQAVFLAHDGHGLGLVALDDVYREHHENFFEDGVAGIRDRRFALDAGASYTLEWAVYVNETGDFFDFLNAVRGDEGLVRTVEGCFAFMDRREPPSEEFVRLRALRYLSVPCLSFAADDKGISIEGIEFTEYPQECALLEETFAETRRRHPGVDVMFHVAHSLYATAKPDDLFPGSRTLDASGKQTDYGGNNVPYYLRYFSKEHVDEGYRWFIFYPAKDNPFGKAMLEATDFMLDEIGVTGMFADGLTHGYGGRFTYDRWDGHTAEIDPDTKTIVRKYASVNLLADPVLIEVVRKINARGGVVIANSHTGTRTFNREDVIYCIETGGGGKSVARLYLAPTVIALGNPGAISCERDVYDDIRDKLEWGGLYFYYGEGEITRPTVTAQMYPITVEEIRRGVVKGKERIVTLRSGIYGWPGDRRLHAAYRYDARGLEADHAFLTTVDAHGVRTDVALAENETAVVKTIPAVVRADGPVNLVARQYDEDRIELVFNATATVALSIENGEFPIEKEMDYSLTVNDATRTVRAIDEALLLDIPMTGETSVELKKRS